MEVFVLQQFLRHSKPFVALPRHLTDTILAHRPNSIHIAVLLQASKLFHHESTPRSDNRTSSLRGPWHHLMECSHRDFARILIVDQKSFMELDSLYDNTRYCPLHRHSILSTLYSLYFIAFIPIVIQWIHRHVELLALQRRDGRVRMLLFTRPFTALSNSNGSLW